MSTVAQVIYDVKEQLKLTTDDVDISNEYIHHLLNLERSKYIKQKYTDYRRTIPESILQAIELELELTDIVPGITTADKILRSKIVVPNFINLEGRSDFVKLISRDFTSIPFSFVSFDRFPYTGNNSWTSNTIYGTIGPDGRLYIKSGTGISNPLKLVLLYSIFEDTETAYYRSSNYTTSTNYLDTVYPLSGELIELCVSEVVKKLNITKNNQIDDRENNSDES